MKQELLQQFERIFGTGGDCRAYFAPGRVNLIGEHTDYNGGHVFPCALTIGTYAVIRKRNDRRLRFHSLNFEKLGVFESTLEQLEYKKEDQWTNYPKGVLWAMKKKGFSIEYGLDILYFGNIPNGSGLSSSASLEVLTGYLLKDLFDLEITNTELALIGQYSENHYNGVNCGIMDQFAVAMGRKNHAIFLDTADLSYEYAPLELGAAKIIIMNTKKVRGLGDSKYNERRSECEAALAELQKVLPIRALGELTEEQFEAHKDLVKDPIQRKRAKHAVYENQRTIRAVQALKNNDLMYFGKLMAASHNSLQYDYEVTGIELDTIVEAALKQEGVYGARMTGAGFGGCAVSIVQDAYVDTFISKVGKEYEERIGHAADFYVVEVGDGPVEL